MKSHFTLITLFFVCLIAGASFLKSETLFAEKETVSTSQGRVARDRESYEKTVRQLNRGWEYIGIGNSYDTNGQYAEAAAAYRHAYEADPGNRVFSGFKLIKAYEKIQQYDEAIKIVNDVLATQRLGKRGIDDFTAIRARLIAAKSSVESA